MQEFKKNIFPRYHKYSGFSLIEVLVVISIITILSAGGLAIYSKVNQSVKDTKRKLDVEAMAKAYELNYKADVSSDVSGYAPLTGDDFASGYVPTPPDGGSYAVMIGGDTSRGFRICAPLSAHTLSKCDTSSATCFCKDSQQGKFVPNL